jgi:hypothetical protein
LKPVQGRFVNGDSHAAGAEAATPHAFAEDDQFYYALGRRAHPDNARVSWGCGLANHINAVLDLAAESASSNSRIMRTTREWMTQNTDQLSEALIIIGWSTWERQEWVIDEIAYQITASGDDWLPQDHRQRYQQWILDLDWQQLTLAAHEQIWQFHLDLTDHGVRHLFFNGNNSFNSVGEPRDWNRCYLRPYEDSGTYDAILRENGYKTVTPKSWHFGADAHCFWADFLLQYIEHHNI